MPYSLAAPVTSDLLIKKSRFIGCVQTVPDRAAAQAIVAGLRAQHPQAAHVCWALLTANKIPLQRWHVAQCSVPYALEGWLRRELQRAGSELTDVTHASQVQVRFRVLQDAWPALKTALDEGGAGALAWLDEPAR